MRSLFAACILLPLLPQVAFAQAARVSEALPSEKLDVSGADIFGFTDPTDIGDVGEKAVELENDGAFGVRGARSRSLAQKLELGYAFAENWSFSVAAHGLWSSLRNSPDFPDKSGYRFDGASVELRHRIIERTATNPFAVTLALEPRWSRIDALSGQISPGYSVEGKIQIDAPITDKLFWGMNLVFETGRLREPLGTTWESESGTAISTALAYELSEEKLWAGVEARWEQAWSKGFFGPLAGQALYLGPTIAFKARKNLTVNAVYLPQIAGKARGVGGPLDLDNFQRANFRLKVSMDF